MLVCDVTIVGGGYSGLSLALMLAQSGIKTTVIEQSPPQQKKRENKPCRLFALATATCGTYAKYDIDLDFASIGQPITYIRVLDHGSTAILDFCPQDLNLDNFGYMVEERELYIALMAQIKKHPNITLLEEQAFKNFFYQDGNIIVEHTGGVTSGQLIVGADGKNSRVRRYAGIEVYNHNYRQIGIVCDVQHSKPHHGVAVERFMPNGPFAMLPKKGGYNSSIVWTDDLAMREALCSLTPQEMEHIIAHRFGEHLGEVTLCSTVEMFPLELRHARKYYAKQLALIGDAAHAVHPVAGQGFNLGLRDADTLARLLTTQQQIGLPLGSEIMLSQYQKSRLADNNLLIESTHLLNSIFASHFLPTKALRRVGMRLLNNFPLAKKAIMRYASGL